MKEYDRIFDWYRRARGSEAGVPAVTSLLDELRPDARVLDLGCGTGLPLGRLILDRGCKLHGVDSSARMIESFRANCPEASSECSGILDSAALEQSFDAVLAWGVLFHLEPEDQGRAIARVSRALVPGGSFVFTSARGQGSTEGDMNGVRFHYISLGSDTYRRLLAEHGLRLCDEYADPFDNYIYSAVKL